MEDEVIEMSRLRKLIAGHMIKSKQTSAHVTNMIEIDVTGVVTWRNRIKDEFTRREGEKITYLPIFLEAIIKALKDRFGKGLIHQRCTIHKDRNIQRHLPKRYRKEAHHKFRTALEQKHYRDAKEMLLAFEQWLRDINESAANSLLEAIEELLLDLCLQGREAA